MYTSFSLSRKKFFVTRKCIAGSSALLLWLGIFPIWNRLLSWITSSGPTSSVWEEPVVQKELKHKDIPVLEDYKKDPPAHFWNSFPFNDIPVKPVTRVKTDILSKMITSRKHLMKSSELIRANKAVDYLKNGAPSHQVKNLPALNSANSESAYVYGASLSDTLADWIHEGFVAGPFVYPPLKNFRVNPMKMVPQNGKVRPVLNVSSPIGFSFNDNVSESSLEKVIMSSAKKFGQSVLMAGKGAKMTKFDMRNAYKIVPCNMKDLRLQGFKWGGRFFAELDQIFGAKTAVPNYDIVSNTVKILAVCMCEIPRHLVHRQIDDVPIVAPKNSSWCESFTKEYENVCESLNIPLAPDCPRKDKAFKNSSSGKVLGISFNCEDLSWKLPEDKRTEYLNMVHESLSINQLSIEKCQSLLGKLAFVCTMCQWMRTFKKPLQDYLTSMIESGEEKIPFPEEVSSDLLVWWAFLADGKENLPIMWEHQAPPLRCKVLTSDAAGWKFRASGGNRVGMGCVGLNEEGEIFFASQKLWKSDASRFFLDHKSKHLGSKTTTLEFAGILIPFLSCPDLLRNQFIKVQVDNIGCVYAWQNGYCKEDNLASILVRLLVFVSSYLSCQVLMFHHPRDSSWESKLADRLSRTNSTSENDRKLLKSFGSIHLPVSFAEWMENPVEDWNMPKRVVCELSTPIFMPE